VALRGDLPSGQVGLANYLMLKILVRFIREHSGDHFHIEVALILKCTRKLIVLMVDIQRFVEKVNAGANAGITQFFFNPDAYFYFIERIAKAGVDIPVAPGIMPITNASNLIRFADGTGAEIPRWIRKQLAAYGDDRKY
jgi:methylenetetrahydrofolate reductase (NADPH)